MIRLMNLLVFSSDPQRFTPCTTSQTTVRQPTLRNANRLRKNISKTVSALAKRVFDGIWNLMAAQNVHTVSFLSYIFSERKPFSCDRFSSSGTDEFCVLGNEFFLVWDLFRFWMWLLKRSKFGIYNTSRSKCLWSWVQLSETKWTGSRIHAIFLFYFIGGSAMCVLTSKRTKLSKTSGCFWILMEQDDVLLLDMAQTSLRLKLIHLELNVFLVMYSCHRRRPRIYNL